MSKQNLDKYSELNSLIQEKKTNKLEALAKITTAKAEAEMKLAAAVKKNGKTFDDMDIDEFISNSAEISGIPEYIKKLDAKYYQLRDMPFGTSDDVFMGNVKALAGEINDEFEEEVKERLSKLWELISAYYDMNDKVRSLENEWLCTTFASFVNRSPITYYLGPLFSELYNNNFSIKGYNPYR